SSRRRHTRWPRDWSSDVCSSDLSAEARVRRIVIEQKQSPAYEGQSLGSVGQDEILTGKAYGGLDPKNAHNTIITDLQFALHNVRSEERRVGKEWRARWVGECNRK